MSTNNNSSIITYKIKCIDRPFVDFKMARLTFPSFNLLLYLEWLLLATAVFMEALLPFHYSWSILQAVTATVIFGLMGLRLPKVNLITKLLYTALEFCLILFPVIQNQVSPRPIFLLCLVLVMRSCLIFKRFGQLVVLSLSLISYGTLLLSRPIVPEKFQVAAWNSRLSLDWRLSNVLLFGLTLIFALLLINALLAERESREQLQIAHQELEITHEQLRQYALRIEDQATLQERNRIAREIHDGLGHTLAAQTIQINNAILFWSSNGEKALTFVKQAKQLGADALLEIRRSLSVLRSNPLQGQSLESSIEKLLTDFQQNTGIEPSSKIDLILSLPTELNTAIYRIVQESLTNIYKHAEATSITITLLCHAGMIHLSIEDNGKGFNQTENTTGFGLQGMRERTVAFGGQFNLHSQLGKGCCVSVSFPLSKVLL